MLFLEPVQDLTFFYVFEKKTASLPGELPISCKLLRGISIFTKTVQKKCQKLRNLILATTSVSLLRLTKTLFLEEGELSVMTQLSRSEKMVNVNKEK